MNIFSVLSMGKSRLHETSMSAMLGYLLDPYQDHGLGNKFLIEFLKIVPFNEFKSYIDKLQSYEYKVEIGLEVGYENEEKKRHDIDVQIKIFDSEYMELHRIIIENKIKVAAAQEEQLKNYYEVVKNELKKNNNLSTHLSVIFLTPETNHNLLENEYNALITDNKAWLYWNSQNSENLTIVKLIQKLLVAEQYAEISPMNEYIRHTLKALAYFITYSIVDDKKSRVFENFGEVDSQREIVVDSKKYIVKKRDSGQIQLFDIDENQMEARPILRKYIESNSNLNAFAIEMSQNRSNGLTTRDYGNIIFNHIKSEIL